MNQGADDCAKRYQREQCQTRYQACHQALLLHIGKLESEVKGYITNIETRLAAMDQALVMRTTDLELRLSHLNAIRQDLVEDRDLLVRKDVFNSMVTSLDNFKADYLREHAIVVNRLSIIETRIYTVASIVVFIVAIIELAAHLWKG